MFRPVVILAETTRPILEGFGVFFWGGGVFFKSKPKKKAVKKNPCNFVLQWSLKPLEYPYQAPEEMIR